MKKELNFYTLIITLLLLTTFSAKAQLKIGSNPTVLNPNAVLEIESTNKGLLLPRIALTNTTSPSPLTAHVVGMMVYNTATSNDVVPGYYYNDGTKWIGSSTGGVIPTTALDYRRGDNTWQPLNKAAVGLSNVDNTSDTNKPISSAVQTALNDIDSDVLTNAAMISIHTTDIATLNSTKANIASPTFTGIPTGPTAASGTNTDQLATTAFVLANVETIGDATETVKGKVQLATAAETLNGTDNSKAVHPAGLKSALDLKANQAALDATNVTVGTKASNSQLTAVTDQVNLNTPAITANTAAIALKADQTSLDATNANVATNTTNIAANTAAFDLKAPLASPAFTGTPTAPDPTTNGGIANKQYVDSAITTAALADATELVKGKVQFANDTETTTGTDATKAVSPYRLKPLLDSKATVADLTNLSSTVTGHTTSIATISSDIATKASQADLDATNANVTANTANITANTTAIGTKANQSDLVITNSKADANKTQIDINTADLLLKANQVDLNTTNTNVSTNATNIANITTNIALKAPIANPTFTGLAKVPDITTNNITDPLAIVNKGYIDGLLTNRPSFYTTDATLTSSRTVTLGANQSMTFKGDKAGVVSNFVIGANGNTSIGYDTTPTAGNTLDVNGNANIVGNTNVTGDINATGNVILNKKTTTPNTIMNILRFVNTENGAGYRNTSIVGLTGTTIDKGQLLFAVNPGGGDANVAEAMRINENKNVLIGVNPDVPSAILNVTSTTKGVLMPRQTAAQRTAITTPATGLQVYQTDATEGQYLNTSTGWKKIVLEGEAAPDTYDAIAATAITASATSPILVYVSGANPTGTLIIDKASSTTASKSRFSGLIINNIAAGASCKVYRRFIVSGIDTSLMTAGTSLYLGDDGAFTTIPPAQNVVSVGNIANSGATNGVISFSSFARSYDLANQFEQINSGTGEVESYFRSNVNANYDPIQPAHLTNKKYVDAAIASNNLYQGSWDANTNIPALAAVGTAQRGWTYDIATSSVGSKLYSNMCIAATMLKGNQIKFNGTCWEYFENDYAAATTTQVGVVKLATDINDANLDDVATIYTVKTINNNFENHKGKTNNPHNVTAEQLIDSNSANYTGIGLPANASQQEFNAAMNAIVVTGSPAKADKANGAAQITDANGATYTALGTILGATQQTINAAINTKLANTTSATTVLYTTAPLTGGGDLSTDRTLSMPAATGTTDGYLKSSDFAAFNTKQGALTLATTGNSGAATLVSNTLTIPNYTLAGLGGQAQLNGTGLVKMAGTTVSYDATAYAPLASPALTGTPTAVTNGTVSNNSTQIATNEFVQAAILPKTLNGLSTATSTAVVDTDNILQGIGKLQAQVTANASTSVNHTGDVTGTVALTIANKAVTYAKMQNVSATDKVLGRVSAGAGAVEEISTTGSGNVVRATSPVLVTPDLGTPSAMVGTNISGTAANLTSGKVTTNANLTGDVTSVGNATTIADATVTGKKITGYVSGAGTVTATDTVLEAIQKLGGSNGVAGTETAVGHVQLATAAETTTGTLNTKAVHPAGLKVELDKKANLASPALTGTPTAPTATAGTNTTQLATTAFVMSSLSANVKIDEFTATAGQTSFTISGTPLAGSAVRFYINGVRIQKTALNITGTTATYDPANNDTFILTAGDSVTIEYLK
jgi:hypothetical protein